MVLLKDNPGDFNEIGSHVALLYLEFSLELSNPAEHQALQVQLYNSGIFLPNLTGK